MTLECLALAGPTASGKSAAAMAIARVLPVEIISVDSAQIYVGMDIGTAKPSAAERREVAHHLIDIIDPRETYSAARFAGDATSLIGEIRARGRVPLLVGGTMLYYKALFEGLDALPAADAALRTRIDELAAERGWPAVHHELARLDPATASRLQPNDRQRLQRALEVVLIGGRPLSELQRGHRDGAHAQPTLLALEPRDRGWLHARIAQRFRIMLRDGLVDEVRRLRARGDLTPAMPSMRCVGYRQVWQALDIDALPSAEDKGIAATRQLAKRQLTWLRSMSTRQVIEADAGDATRRAMEWALRAADRLAA